MTTAGELTQRVRLERLTDTSDQYGGGAGQAWTPVGDAWAKTWPVGGAERREAEKDVTVVRQRFKIRWRSDVTADDMRVVWGGMAYTITFVATEGRQSGFLTLDCASGEAV